MKLYTEEQVREAFDNGYKYASTLRPTALEEHYKYVENSIKSLTPIELPTDEEIGKEMDKLPFSKHIDDGMFNDGQLMGFELGAKWMKEQILNPKKEKQSGTNQPAF